MNTNYQLENILINVYNNKYKNCISFFINKKYSFIFNAYFDLFAFIILVYNLIYLVTNVNLNFNLYKNSFQIS